MRAAIYTRASLDRTGEGKSNDRQREECVRLVDYKRWDLVEVDGHPSADDISISAYGEKERPAWLRCLRMIEDGDIDVLVAWHLDRLTRNMSDLETLIVLCEKHNVSIATATGDIDLTNDTGRMVARILAAVARQEVERKAARQKLAHVQRRAEGRPWSAVKMLGYSPTGEVIEEEAAAIRQAMQEVIDGGASLTELGKRWHALGLTSPYKDDDKPWTPRGVKKILTNPRIAGFITHEGVVLGKGAWEPLVDEDTMTLVTAKLNEPNRVSGTRKKGGPLPTNLLTGIMRCSKCSETVRAGSKRGVDIYQCPKWHTTVPRVDADELARSSIASAFALTSPDAILEPPSVTVDAGAVLAEIDALRSRLEMLTDSFMRGVTSSEQYERAVLNVNAQIKGLEDKAGGAGEEVEWNQVRANLVRTFLGGDMYQQRRALIRIATITMHPANGRASSARRQVKVLVKGRRGEIPAYVPE